MGRPSAGAAARNRVVSVKVTQAEATELTEVFGSPGKGLRALLDARTATAAQGRTMAEPEVVTVVAFDGQVDLLDEPDLAVLAERPLEPAGIEMSKALTEQGRALASLRDDLIADGVDPADLAVPAFPGVTQVQDVDIATMEQPLPRHLHRRNTKIATEFRNGSKVEVWACECGAEMR